MDLALPQAVVKVADVAQIPCHCGVDQQLQLQLDPSLGTSTRHKSALKKKKKTNTVWFHLYERDKFIETENRIEVTRGWGKLELLFKGQRVCQGW